MTDGPSMMAILWLLASPTLATTPTTGTTASTATTADTGATSAPTGSTADTAEDSSGDTGTPPGPGDTDLPIDTAAITPATSAAALAGEIGGCHCDSATGAVAWGLWWLPALVAWRRIRR